MAPPKSSPKKKRSRAGASALASFPGASRRLKQLSSRLGRFLGGFWVFLVDGAKVLWITRVSVISVLIGALSLMAIPQVRDTFLEMRGEVPLSKPNLLLWGIFFFSAVFFWTLPVHYAARRNVRRDPDLNWCEGGRRWADWWGTWIPRLLGAACLLAITVGALLAQRGPRVPPEGAGSGPPSALEQLHQHLNTQTDAIALVAALLCIIVFLYLIFRRDLLFQKFDERMGTALLAVLFVLFAILFFVPAAWLGLARAPLFPLLLGGWIPLLAWLAFHGRVRRAPLILLLFVVFECLAIFFGNNHDVRVLWASPDDSLSRNRPDPAGRFLRVPLDRAIEDWKAANCREGYCPRPILVAASGGASRAAFFTAATLGELVDRTRRRPELNDFQNQLFAISSVSGSSTGAAFFTAALRKAGPAGINPCQNPTAETWRQCMEDLLSGDFISSTLMGFVYKDAIRGLAAPAAMVGLRIPDRAALLERSWENQFCRETRRNAKTCGKEKFLGLEAPFLKVAIQSDQDRAEKKWFPLLFFNGTDADTGRRIVVSPIASHMKPEGKESKGDRIFSDAYDFHDLIADLPASDNGRGVGEQAAQPEGGLERDVSLSTAALLSARFPLISPAANVRNRKGKLVVRIVDGGYFENFGAATTMELAQRLRRAGLSPFIIQITNDPELLVPSRISKPRTDAHDPTLCEVEDTDPLCEKDPPIIGVADLRLFAGIREPLGAFFGSRNAQGGRALRALSTFSGPGTSFCPSKSTTPDNPQPVGFVHIVVHPQYRVSGDGKTCEPAEVPLNWWLSKPVRAYLAYQLNRNEAALEKVTEVMKPIRRP